MTNLQAILLGVLQGFTEFLPVSSSGHLVLAEEWFHVHLNPEAILAVNVLLHAGTLLALLLMYHQRWWALTKCVFTKDAAHQKLLLLIVLATIPAVVAGVLTKDILTDSYYTSSVVAVCFFVTAFVLWLGEQWKGQNTVQALSVPAAIMIGIAQAIALLPGISRSGSSISAARMFGLSRKEAMDFSFLMAVPALAGAVVYMCISSVGEPLLLPSIGVLVVSFITSFLSSIIAILFLQRFVRRHSFVWFSIYLVIAGAVLHFA